MARETYPVYHTYPFSMSILIYSKQFDSRFNDYEDPIVK